MIYTITFNPSIDYIISLAKFNEGEVNRTTSEDLRCGGKGINVSLILNNLGVRNIALGFKAGFTGEYIEQELQKKGIITDFIHLENGNTRINVKIEADRETEINANGPYISENDVKKLFLKLDQIKDGDILILSGSIPSSLSDDIYENIMKYVSDKKVMIVVDATKDLLLNVLKYKPFLIKPNNFELSEIFKKDLLTEEDIISHAEKLRAMGAKNVLVSMGSKGAILVAENGEYYKMGIPSGKAINSVGAGDSMVAGFIAGYLKKKDYGYAIKLGTAAGSATAFSTGLAEKQDIDRIFNIL